MKMSDLKIEVRLVVLGLCLAVVTRSGGEEAAQEFPWLICAELTSQTLLGIR